MVHETDEYSIFIANNEPATRVVRCHPMKEFDVKRDEGWTNEAATCLRCVAARVR